MKHKTCCHTREKLIVWRTQTHIELSLCYRTWIGREVVFQCRDEGPIRARVSWSRRNSRQLPPGARDINGRLEIPNIQMEHSGEYVCEAVGYPKSAPGSFVTVQLTVEKCEFPMKNNFLSEFQFCGFCWNAAWSLFKFIPRNRKIRYGFVPHIGREFFGTGRWVVAHHQLSSSLMDGGWWCADVFLRILTFSKLFCPKCNPKSD